MIVRFVVGLLPLFLLAACGSPNNTKSIIESTETTPIRTDTIALEITEAVVPTTAIMGDFNGDLSRFYANISDVNAKNQITEISFQDNKTPPLYVQKTLGGALSLLTLEGFNRDLLLFTAKLKDPNFHKYYVFVHREGRWKEVVNSFAIHKSNFNNDIVPISENPDNPDELLRYYSVFDLDETNPDGYIWRLLQERVAIQNK